MKTVIKIVLCAVICIEGLKADILADLRIEKDKIQSEINNLKPGQRTWKYPFGIPKREIEKMKRSLKDKLNSIEEKIKEEENKLESVKWKICSVQVVEKSRIKFWKFNPSFYIAIDGERVSEIHWHQKNAYFGAKEFEWLFLDEKNSVIEVWQWEKKGRSEKQFEISFDLKSYREEGTHEITIKGKGGEKISYEVKLKRCD